MTRPAESAQTRIRLAGEADADEIARIHLASRSATMPYLPPQQRSHEEVTRWIRDVVLRQCRTWVAARDTEIMGYAALDGDILEDLYLRPDALRQGIGTLLLDEVRRHSPDGVSLYVFQQNTGARAFYERHGFTVVDTNDGERNMEHLPDMTLRWVPVSAPATSEGTDGPGQWRAELAESLEASSRAGAVVAAAFLAVPRHVFLPQVEARKAYRDKAILVKSNAQGLPVSSSSQPTMMAIMLEQLGLANGQRVLEIGAGTGYNAAVMKQLVGDSGSVVTIDVEPDLVEQARASLAAAGCPGVTVICGDGADGAPALAPFDRVIVTAGAWDLAPQWLEQLADGGRIVLPLSIRGIQLSVAFSRAETGTWVSDSALRCQFIRMTGATAGPESFVPLGPQPGLHALVADGPAPQADLLYEALSGPVTEAAAGIDVDRIAELADLDLWLTLTEPSLSRVNLMDRDERHENKAQERIAGLMPLGGYTRAASSGDLEVAALAPPSGAGEQGSLAVAVHGYGAGGGSLARYLAERAVRWNGLGRPGADRLKVSAYQTGTAPQTPAGTLIIQRPHVTLAAGW